MPVTWTIEPIAGGLLCVAFEGCGGIGSDANPDGELMRRPTGEVVAEYSPTGLMIDLRGFDYRFGDWIGTVPIAALKPLGLGHVACSRSTKPRSASAVFGGHNPSRSDRPALS
jgi:hypothetical protein